MNRREAIQLMIVAGLASDAKLLAEPLSSLPSPGSSSLAPTRLRCENRIDPLGIDVISPRLSWILEAVADGQRNLRQSAYRILVASSLDALKRDNGDLWDSEKVASGTSIQVEYAGKPLASRTHLWWKVRVWDQQGQDSPWSQPAAWSMGLLAPHDWQAKWIGLDSGAAIAEEFEDAHWISSDAAENTGRSFRGTVNVPADNPVSSGIMMITGTAAITVAVNGAKIASAAGHSMPQLVAADVTPKLRVGENDVSVTMEPGSAQSVPAVIGGLTLDLADGSILHLRTGTSWGVSDKAVTGSPQSPVTETTWSPAQIVDLATPSNFPPIRTRLPARLLRTEFEVDAPVRRATAYISGVGISELYLNGQRVGDEVLSPNLSAYDKRIYYRTYDVTNLLQRGPNAVGAFLGNGRYFSLRNYIPRTQNFGYPKLIFQLEIEFRDGSRDTIVSDEKWRVTSDGPIRLNNEYDGEDYDARMELDGWNRATYSDASWKAAELVQAPPGRMCAQMNEPIRIIQEMKPTKITQPRPGVYIFDMGQNMVGWCRVQVAGARGTAIRLRHAETLRENGMLYTDNLRSARATDRYVLRGSGVETYHPRFTYHGFRYVELTGFPGTPTRSTIVGQVVHDALDEHADFVTSNDTLNHIYKNVLWGTRGNYRSIPTDCPQRDERQGWLGDRSSESKGETFMFNVGSFYPKWIADIQDTLTAQGALDDVAPGYWKFYSDNVTWPGTFIIVTAAMHEQYGDRRIVQDYYPAMKSWMDYMSAQIKDDLMPRDTYGDWCVPPESLKLIHSKDPARQTASEVIGTTYFYYLLRLMSQFAAIVGMPDDQRAFDALSTRMSAALNAKYFHPMTGTYANGSQTSSILPLAFGMVPEVHRKAVASALAQNIRLKTDSHIGSGLIGTQWIMRTLSRNGYSDLAYQIATQTTYPSWGYMIGRGATTIWELWNGDTADPAMNSRNHLMLVGDLVIWFYENLAGIRTDPADPGFKHVIIQPTLVGDLRFVRASHDSPHGKIGVAWERSDNQLALNVSIPANVTATIYVPTTDRKLVREGGRAVTRAFGMRFSRMENGAAVYDVGSGSYAFTSPI